ncbi:hypothetical protein BD289DRAFT_238691 [Coniella lustricola]|uniref:Uncharacterized protein n=1 Tax=Coniella lustricola TaxID=2025994 RepID=A0A2T3ALE1_9PEZI|nr:hypothetical protein BD289DRAFT_238691 [Coniella lustricola]
MAWFEVAVASFVLAFRTMTWALFSTAHAVVYILRLVAWPFGALANAIFFIISPLTYTIRYLLSPFYIIARNFPRLQPLYIYFGSAAFAGIAVGIILNLTAYTAFSILSLHGPDKKQPQRPSPASTSARPPSSTSSAAAGGAGSTSKYPGLSLFTGGNNADSYQSSHYKSASAAAAAAAATEEEQREFDALLAGIGSSPESDYLDAALYGVQGSGWRVSPNTKRARRSASGLGGNRLTSARFSTILEEDDDSF